MSFLALDIETASGANTAPELLGIAAAYQSGPNADTETIVFTRENEDPLYAATSLLGQLQGWAKQRSPNYTLTYSDTTDIESVLETWSARADEKYSTMELSPFVGNLFSNHVKLQRPATALQNETSSPISREIAFDNANVSFTAPQFPPGVTLDRFGSMTGPITPDSVEPARDAYLTALTDTTGDGSIEPFQDSIETYLSARTTPLLALAETMRQTI